MEDFEQLLNQSFKTIKKGGFVEGTILAVSEDKLVVNIGYKHDGIVQKNDAGLEKDALLTENFKVGDEIKARVISTKDADGNVTLSLRNAHPPKFESDLLKNAFENKETVKAPISSVNEKGLVVVADGVTVFIPASLSGFPRSEKLEEHVGEEIEFLMEKYSPSKNYKDNHIIGNRRELVIKERETAREAALERLNEGDVLEAPVKSINKKFGVFVDLDGIDGLLRNEETGWGHRPKLEDAFKVGENVTVFVKTIDRENKKVALSCKFPDQDPMKDLDTRFPVGTVLEGKVTHLTEYGAFVEIAENVEGLLHISEISNTRIEKVADALKVGDVVNVKVVRLDLEKNKISLSMKALTEAPETEEKSEEEKSEEQVEG